MEPTDGPCADWIDRNDVEMCNGCTPDAEIEPDIYSDAISTASFILYELSGRQYNGICTTTVRPCRRASSYSQPSGWNWERSWGRCICSTDTWQGCSCGGIDKIGLGRYPIIEVTEVKIDGDVVSAADYRVDDYRWLVRIDGDPWPVSQDLSLASTEDDTFEVTFTHGKSIPRAGVRAAARLACELAKNYSGRACKLPERIQSISRQGITMAFVDPFDFLDKGKTGIYEVDLFLAAVNRHARTGRARVSSPDVGPTTTRLDT